MNESSGSLLRALGLGKAVIVSNVGSFAEFPGDICLKAPVDATEEDILFEYLNLLVSRPLVRREVKRSKDPVEQREMDGEVHIDRFFLDPVMPVVESRRHDVLAEVVEIPAHIGVDERGMDVDQ